MSKDYYKILGVSKDVSDGDLKKAYRKLSMKYHPDRNSGDKKAEEKFKEINEAYSVLSDPNKRSDYDNPNPFVNIDPTNFGFPFSFSRRRANNIPIKGALLKAHVEVSIHTLVLGGEGKIVLSYNDTCPDCNGKGSTETEKCAECRGSGFVTRVQRSENSFMQSSTHCNKCRGAGSISISDCETCSGRGFVIENKKIRFEIKSNTPNGSIILLEGKGKSGINRGPNGDVKVLLTVKLPKAEDLTEEQIKILKEL